MDRAGVRGKVTRLSVVAIAILAVLSISTSAGCSGAAALSPQQVLERSVTNLLGWKSYHYSGTSKLAVASDARLDNEGTFETDLAQNGRGGLDGHMVVKAPPASYQTYTSNGVMYTQSEGGEWTKAVLPEGGAMVSTTSRKIIAKFADLVDDVRIENETDAMYTLSFTMGEKYRDGAASIAGEPGSSAVGLGMQAGPWNTIEMKLTVDRKSLRPTGVWMKTGSEASGSTPAVGTETRGTYTRINRPVDIKPPAEAVR